MTSKDVIENFNPHEKIYRLTEEHLISLILGKSMFFKVGKDLITILPPNHGIYMTYHQYEYIKRLAMASRGFDTTTIFDDIENRNNRSFK